MNNIYFSTLLEKNPLEMTNEELKKLENDLWASANRLRATGGIKSADYAVPVLGLIFLRFADNKYAAQETAIKKEYEKKLL